MFPLLWKRAHSNTSVVAGYSIFGKGNPGRSMVLAGVLVVIAVAMYWAVRAWDASPQS